MGTETQQDIRIEMLCRQNQGHWWLWVWIPIHSSEEKGQSPLTKNENIQITSDQCAVSDEIFKAIGKKVKTKHGPD